MVQSREERKESIKKARATNHQKNLDEGRKRLDTYVASQTKDGLKELVKMFADVRNEGQAVDLAVQRVLEEVKNNPR